MRIRRPLRCAKTVTASAAEWNEIKEGIKEIESSKFTTLEKLRHGLEKRKRDSDASK